MLQTSDTIGELESHLSQLKQSLEKAEQDHQRKQRVSDWSLRKGGHYHKVVHSQMGESKTIEYNHSVTCPKGEIA